MVTPLQTPSVAQGSTAGWDVPLKADLVAIRDVADAAAARPVAMTGFNITSPTYGATGNGVTDDRAAIQSAINAANAAYVSTGSIQDVIVPQGVFIVGAVNYIQDDGATYGITSLKLLDGVRVSGGGTIKVANGSYGAGAFYRVFSSRDGTGAGFRLSNAAITGITVDGNKANQPASQQCNNILLECKANVTVENVRSINANGTGIMLRGVNGTNATNLRVLGCTVLDAATIGVQVSQFDGLLIDGNYIDTTADNNIDIYGDNGTTTTQSKNFVISNNVCKNSGLVGIFPETVRQGTVSGNIISGCSTSGVLINRINGEPNAILVTGNTVSDCTTGVIVSGDTGGITISGNVFRGFTSSGVQLGYPGGNISYVGVVDNTFIPATAATYLIKVVGNQAAFNTVQRNLTTVDQPTYYLSNTATTNVGNYFAAPYRITAGTANISGSTGSRPGAAVVGAGASWYDTTLSKPIWSNGTVWKDSAGATV